MIVAGIGSRKDVTAAEVVAAVEAALTEHGLERKALTKLATTEFKREERGIFQAAEVLGLEVVVVDVSFTPSPPPPRQARGRHLSPLPGERIGAKPAAIPPLPSRSGGEVVSEANRRGGELTTAQRIETSPSPSRASALDTSPPEGGEERSLSLALAGVESVSEAAALAAAGEGARLAGPRIAVGRVTCAIAFGSDR